MLCSSLAFEKLLAMTLTPRSCRRLEFLTFLSFGSLFFFFFNVDISYDKGKYSDLIVDGTWCMKCSLMFLDSFCYNILPISFSCMPRDDRCVWNAADNGLATPSSAYDLLYTSQSTSLTDRRDWPILWKLKVPPFLFLKI